MKLKCVQDLLSEDEIQIGKSFGYSRPDENSRTGKRILYLVTSENQHYFDWIVSVIYSLFFDELYHLTMVDNWFNESLPQHLTFLMDEFANVTLPDSFVERLSTMRSRNMSAFIIVQNLIQLKRKFPKYDMDHDLIGNCSIIEILGAPDQDSCEYLSKMFGNQTIHKRSIGNTFGMQGSTSHTDDIMEKPLFSAQQMYAMKKDGPAAIIVKGSNPLFEPKVQFENSPLMPLLCRKDHYYEPKNIRHNNVNESLVVDFEKFGDRKLMVNKLMEKGFTSNQINIMENKILDVNTRIDDITEHIKPSMSEQEIRDSLYIN